MLRITDIAENLVQQNDGIWYSGVRSRVSYPVEGNQSCFAVEDISFWFKHRNMCITEAVRQFPPAGPVLDIGGGNGYVSKGLIEAGIEAILVEPGPEGARNARRRGIETVICSTLDDAGFISGAIPAAGMFDVLEHIEDHEEALKNIRELIQPKGYLYLTVPAYKFLYSYEDHEAGHFRRYNRGSITALMESTGFTVKYFTYIFSFLPVPIFLFRTLPTRLGLHRQSTAATVQKEHKATSGFIGSLMNITFDKEIRRIRQRKEIVFGGSCLVVARAE